MQGPCKKNDKYLHPLLLDIDRKHELNETVVPIFPYVKGKNIKKYTTCKKNDITQQEYKFNMYAPTLPINENNYLEAFYQIKSFLDSIMWIDKHIDSINNMNTIQGKSVLIWLYFIRTTFIVSEKELLEKLIKYIHVGNELASQYAV